MARLRGQEHEDHVCSPTSITCFCVRSQQLLSLHVGSGLSSQPKIHLTLGFMQLPGHINGRVRAIYAGSLYVCWNEITWLQGSLCVCLCLLWRRVQGWWKGAGFKYCLCVGNVSLFNNLKYMFSIIHCQVCCQKTKKQQTLKVRNP